MPWKKVIVMRSNTLVYFIMIGNQMLLFRCVGAVPIAE